MNDKRQWATDTFIKALQRGHKVPKGLKEKLERILQDKDRKKLPSKKALAKKAE